MVNSEAMFANRKLHEQVKIVDKVLMNIFTNFIPNKNLTYDDEDPPWINGLVKSEVKWKNQIYQRQK